MLGLMQDWQLTVDKVLDHAAQNHGDREIVTRNVEGNITRTTYKALRERAKAVSSALLEHGIKLGDRVATLAWNTERHMEAWYGTMGIGAVLHTINPRLHPDQVAWIANHAEDRILMFDTTFLPLVEAAKDQIKTIETFIILTSAENMPENSLGAICYEDWIKGKSTDVTWGDFDEQTATLRFFGVRHLDAAADIDEIRVVVQREATSGG